VTAALGAAADLRTSLTRRGVARNVLFVTPRVGEGEPRRGDWAAAVAAADTAVIYMGVQEAAAIASTLLAKRMPGTTPVVAVENATLPQATQHRCTLAELPRLSRFNFSGPVILLVGDVFSAALAAGLPEPAAAVA
jgi:siroheme synthase